MQLGDPPFGDVAEEIGHLVDRVGDEPVQSWIYLDSQGLVCAEVDAAGLATFSSCVSAPEPDGAGSDF